MIQLPSIDSSYGFQPSPAEFAYQAVDDGAHSGHSNGMYGGIPGQCSVWPSTSASSLSTTSSAANTPGGDGCHDTHNPDDGDPSNPFVTNNPAHLSHVEVPDPRCPLTAEQVRQLEHWLSALPSYGWDTMQACKKLWVSALHIAQHL